jgi:polysaccharide chain length determinant protein (PEP-CTERM system associated)
MNEEQSSQINLEQYGSLLWSKRWWIIGPTFAVWLAAVAVSILLPQRYRSETVILIEQQKVPEDFVKPNITTDLQGRLQSMSQEILSRTRLLAIIDKFHLYDNERRYLDRDALVERMRKDIEIDLVRSPGRPADLSAFKISYSTLTPATAQQVTGELTSVFINENLRSREQQSENTTAFLEAQLDEARKTLAQQESRLREFKSHYLGELPEQVQSNVQILSGLQARYQAGSDALSQAEQQKLYLESLLGQYRSIASEKSPSNAAPGTPSLSGLERKLSELNAELTNLSGRYTQQHPDIKRVQQEIASTRALKEQIEKTQQKSGNQEAVIEQTVSGVADTPILQVQSQLKANSLEIANRRAELKRIETQIGQYQARLNLTPVREQQLADLTRDHQQSRSNYESLLSKKQQSEMATELEKRQQGEQFRIIDPPSLPQSPYWPNRLRFSLAGLAIGLVGSTGFLLLMESVNPKIHGEQELRAMIPGVILGSIPTLYTAEETRNAPRRKWSELAFAGVVLATIPVVTLLAYLKK